MESTKKLTVSSEWSTLVLLSLACSDLLHVNAISFLREENLPDSIGALCCLKYFLEVNMTIFLDF